MTCKFEMISENEAYETIYICDKFGFSNRIICTKKTQPSCYDGKKPLICNHPTHFIGSMDYHECKKEVE